MPWRDPQVHDRPRLRRDRRRHVLDRGPLDREDRRHRPRPQGVGHLAAAENVHPLREPPASERNRSIGYAAPRHLPFEGTPRHRRPSGIVAQRVEHPDQRGHGVRRGPPNWPECTGPFSVRTRDQHAPCPPQAGRHRRNARLDVAGVGHDDDVRGEPLGLRRHQPLQPAGRHLLRALADQGQLNRPPAVDLAERPQRREVHDEIPLAVGGPPRIPAPVLLGQRPRVRGPRRELAGRLHVVVRVEQHSRRPGRAVCASQHHDAAVVGLDQLDVAHAELPAQRRHQLGRLPARRGGKPVLRRHRRDRHEPLEVVASLRHEPVDRRRHGVVGHPTISST
jgi:hypothetical protein